MTQLALVEPYFIATGGLAVVNPATGATIARVKSHDPGEVSVIIDAADAARPAWASLTAKARAAILKRWHDLMLHHRDVLAALVTAESGKPLAEAAGEVAYAASFLEWFAEEGKRAYGEVIPSFAAGKRLITLRQPVGTCVAITPWNFPVAMITRKVGPALAAGCSMVVKPAEATPLSALALERLAHEAGIPADVFRITPTLDPAAIGTAMTAHPKVRKLSFTGSTRVGKLLMAQAAAQVIRVSLELGGNAPFIVFGDADLDAAVEGAIAAKFRNAGQTCVCANRILVAAEIHDAFVAKLVARVATLRLGDGSEPGITTGPLINAAAVTKVSGLVSGALAAGANAAIGGTPGPQGGNFYAPTVLTGVTPDMAITREEIFGPVAPVLCFADEAEAIALANDTPYGLAAYFYTRDIGRVWRVLEALEYGMVGVNDGIISTETAPFGGVKQSGIGREGARQGLEEYLEVKYGLIGGIDA